ncbi:hypothetical protein L3C95_19650 [Chitinophaga filiformis]|uniref:hypothetical protein n=1 Tax=Chitinophaga filiformis TaxID=104663 RepID=UPI001F2F5DE8|nr:hypothetical protein [Chitinophaga filiformis]MCF6405127.1 hypothetical protein [Chitinophaga filiformis]
MTLLNGTEVKDYNYPDITFKCGKDPGGTSKQAKEFVEIYSRRNRLIKLEKACIGDYSFDNILAELKQLVSVS